MRKELILIGILTAAFVVGACGSSAPHRVDKEEMSSTWGGQAYKDLLIVGVYDDRTYRVSAETAFSEELKSRGITAEPSYDVIPILSSLSSEAAIADMLASRSNDVLLTVATIDAGYEYDYGDAMATRGMVYLLGGKPGAATDSGTFIAWAGSGFYTLHIGLWDAKTQKPVWQITTDSETTGSDSGDLKALAEFVVDTLREKGLL